MTEEQRFWMPSTFLCSGVWKEEADIPCISDYLLVGASNRGRFVGCSNFFLSMWWKGDHCGVLAPRGSVVSPILAPGTQQSKEKTNILYSFQFPKLLFRDNAFIWHNSILSLVRYERKIDALVKHKKTLIMVNSKDG